MLGFKYKGVSTQCFPRLVRDTGNCDNRRNCDRLKIGTHAHSHHTLEWGQNKDWREMVGLDKHKHSQNFQIKFGVLTKSRKMTCRCWKMALK